MSAESNDSPSDRISWLGGKDVGMAMISPTKDDPDGAVALLRELNATLEKDGVRQRLDKLIDDGDESVRLIQAGRYEFFLYASGKKTSAFDEIAKEMPSDTKQRIVTYATTSAAEDPRLEGGFNYQFGNFSLIVSYGRVPAQAPHIDVVKPNHQFGLIVTDGVQGTLVPEKLETRVRNVDDLLAIWQNLGAEFGLELPTKLAIALRADSTVRKLVASFGDVLLPQKNFDHMVGCPSLSAGSLLSLPGNQVHGAPGITDDNSFRAIIFFSAWPTGTIAVDAYDADTQYTGSLLTGHIVDLLWCQPNIGYNERLFLLHLLERYVTESPVPDVALHFPEGDLSNFILAVERSQFPTERDAFLRSTARNKRFCCQHEQYVEDERLDTEIDLGSLERLSVRDLVTKWRGQEYQLAIYSRGDGSVLLHYPGCKDKDTGLGCFEGADDGERFTLTMDDPAGKRLFDGTNGVLLDAWQRPVRCFRKRTSKPKPSSSSGKPAPSPVRMSSRRQTAAKRKYDPNITRTAINSPDTSAPAPTGMKTRLRAKSVGVQENSDKSSDATEIINVEESKRAPEKPVVKPATKPADTSAPAPAMTLKPRTTRLQVKSGGVQEDSDKSCVEKPQVDSESFPEKLKGPGSKVMEVYDVREAEGRTVKSCSVPGCQKQSRGLRCHGMCQRHFNEGDGKQTPPPAVAAGEANAIGGLGGNNDLGVCAEHYNESRGVRAGSRKASGGGQGGGTTSGRPQKKRDPKKPVAKPAAEPSAKPPEVPAIVEVKTGPPSSKKRRLHPRAARASQCGTCDACMVEDCGVCAYCKDMKRFGGPGKLKSRCWLRPTCEVKGWNVLIA